jgi:PAS domain-containing protein
MKTAAHRPIAPGELHDSFTALMESVSEAVFVIEPRTGRLLEVNQQAASALGYTRAELLTLQAEQIFSTGTEFLQQIVTDNHASSHFGGKLVTKGLSQNNLFNSVASGLFYTLGSIV